MEGFESRYKVQSAWKKYRSGRLARAKDLKLQRDVLLCKVPEGSGVKIREALNRLGHAARFSDRRFLHVLDGYYSEGELFAVLTAENGGPLTERWFETGWSGKEILERVRDLVAGVREARKERLLHFSLSADNIWVDGEGKLRIIDYWTDAETESRDVHGLGQLVFQLCSRSAEKPVSMTAYCETLRSGLTDLPGGSADDAVKWACSVFHPSCTLREFEAGLNRLLTPGQAATAAVLEVKEQRGKKGAGIRLRPLHLICLAVLIGCMGLVWLLASPDSADGKEGEAAEITAVIAAVGSGSEVGTGPQSETGSGTGTGSGSGSGLGSMLQTQEKNVSPTAESRPTPSTSPSTVSRNNVADGVVLPSHVQAERGKVPNLVGLTREAAEKLALQAGLKYQFIIAPDSSVQGTVFKQDLRPNDAVRQGDRITFWVSKGQ